MIRVTLVFLFLVSTLSFADYNPGTLSVESSKNKIEIKREVSKEDIELREKLRNPQETMHTFITAMDKVKGGNNAGFSDAVSTLDLSEIDATLRKLTGKMTAERLVNTLDRIAKINFTHIPMYENGPKWLFRKQTVSVDGNIFDVEIAIGKTADGLWKFTPETISSVENFYASVAHQKVVRGITEYRNWKTRIKEQMPEWSSEDFLMFKKGQWLGLAIIFMLSLVFLILIRFLIAAILHYRVSKRTIEMEEGEQYNSTLPFGFLAMTLIWTAGVRLLEFDVEVMEIFVRVTYILTAFSFVWSALKLVDYISLHFFKKAKNTSNKFDAVLIPMMKKTSKVVVVAFGIILIAHSLTFDIASILAGLGIGGVAVALAAKDTISNLFGSVTVIIDRPFQIGDYVVLGKDLEGSIEEVGFRSTRIRTPVNSLVTLPNSVLANMAIDNYGMRRVRRFRTSLQMEYSTPIPKLQEFCDRIKYQIQLNPVILKEDQSVTIYELGASSISIMLTVFFVTGEYKVELAERHKFIVEILKIAEEVGVKFAYPSHTVFLNEWQNTPKVGTTERPILP
jgi:MscS family membrane protein